MKYARNNEGRNSQKKNPYLLKTGILASFPEQLQKLFYNIPKLRKELY